MTQETIKEAREIIEFFKEETSITGMKIKISSVHSDPLTLDEWEKFLDEQEEKYNE